MSSYFSRYLYSWIIAITLMLIATFSMAQVDKQQEIERDVSLLIQNETMPEFPGGIDSLFKFIHSNLLYPDDAIKNKIEGTVYVSFVVNEKGAVSNVNLVKGIGYGCDAEAVRLVKMMPDWKPGLNNRKPVDVKLNLPIKYTLVGKEKRKKRKKQK